MPESPTVAAVDCGTNTIKLLIGSGGGGALVPTVRESRMVRLGQDLDRTGVIAEEALERAFAALDEYAALIAEHDVTRLRFCATSATRDAANSQVFVDGVRTRMGVAPEVIAGAAEAALAFDGAIRGLRVDAPAPRLVIDIGGGSTELILGDSEPTAAHSMDIGSVRLHERHLHSDPPTSAEVAACIADIDAHLDASPVDPADGRSVIGVAGTTLSVVAAALDLPAYDREAIDQRVVGVEDLHSTVARLVAMPVADRLAIGSMHPGRADVIDAGALILSRVLRRTPATTLIASESDILEGIAWSLLA